MIQAADVGNSGALSCEHWQPEMERHEGRDVAKINRRTELDGGGESHY